MAYDQNDVIIGVIDRVKNLLGRKADVHGMQHRAHHWHREETLQIPMGIPIHDCHRIAPLYPQAGEPEASLPTRSANSQ
jgi:hypothetical protein